MERVGIAQMSEHVSPARYVLLCLSELIKFTALYFITIGSSSFLYASGKQEILLS